MLRAADAAELAAGLAAIARGEEHELVTHSAKTTPPRIAFVFPGQGNQWQAMGAGAYRELPAYREAADRCAEEFVVAGFASPLPYLVGEEERSWSRPEIQGAQFTHAVSLAEAWRCCGVLPDITIGHSLGEVAAAYVAEAISLPDAVALVVARATVVGRLTGRYAMAVLGAGLDVAESLLAEAPGWVEVSAVNGPSSTVVAGDHDAVAAAVRLAQQRDVFTHQLSVDYPGHTSALRPLRASLAELTPRSAFRDGPVRFVGSTRGAELGEGTDFSDYWYENLCGTVRFDLAVQYARACGPTRSWSSRRTPHCSIRWATSSATSRLSSARATASGRSPSRSRRVSPRSRPPTPAAGGPMPSRTLISLRCGASRTRRCARCTSGRRRNE